VLKVQQQVVLAEGGAAPSMMQLLRQPVRSAGAAGLVRGLPSLIARDMPFNALFYGSYESCCAAMMRRGTQEQGRPGAEPHPLRGRPRG